MWKSSLLAEAIPTAAAGVHLTVTSDAIGLRELAWGSQTDAREITSAEAQKQPEPSTVPFYCSHGEVTSRHGVT